jgi:hypothetical protein
MTNSEPKPGQDQGAQELPGEGNIKPIDYGVITGGSCATPEDQEAFDEQQKGKPPLMP